MKGLLKGLRYISRVFDADEEEPEMEIGFPTDVKHVAHIGWDGPSVTSPSWMADLKPGASLDALAVAGDTKEKSSQDYNGASARGTTSRDLPAMPLPKPPKRHPSSSSSTSTSSASVMNLDSPTTTKHSKRQQSASVASPDPDKPESSRRGRRERERNITAGSDMSNYTSSPLHQQDQPDQPDAAPAAPSKPRRRKEKGSPSSSGGSSSKPSRSKNSNGKAAERHLPRLKPAMEDEDGC